MVEIIVVLICLFLNSLLSAFEMAFVSVGRPELRRRQKGGDAQAAQLLKLRENPERTLSTLQVGITLVGAISAAVGGAGAEEHFAPYFERTYLLSEDMAEALAIGLVVLPLTYLNVVLSELVPKTIALRNPVKLALASTRWLIYGERLLGPVVSLLELSTKFILKIFFKGARPAPTGSEADSLDLSQLTAPQRQYVLNLVDMETKRIRDIQQPWDQAVCISLQDSLEHVLSRIIVSGHTRLPVFSDGQVMGILHSKELLSLVSTGSADWVAIVREPLRIRDTEGLLKTLREMQVQSKHMAIVYAGTNIAGLVTMEDILEEIVGEIYDEDDDGKIKRLMARRFKSSRV